MAARQAVWVQGRADSAAVSQPDAGFLLTCVTSGWLLSLSVLMFL